MKHTFTNLSCPEPPAVMWKNLRINLALVFALFALPLFVFSQGPGVGAYKKGVACYKQKDLQCALDNFNQAIQLEGTNYVYYARKGIVLMKMKKLDEAATAFRGALQQNPQWTSAYVQLAKIALGKKDYNGAIQELNQAFNVEQDKAKKLQYKLLVVKLLTKQNRPQEAMTQLQQAKSVAPGDMRVLKAEGEILLELKQYAQAKQAFQAAVSKAEAGGLSGGQLVKYKVGLAIATYKSGDKENGTKIAENGIKPYSSRYYKYTMAKMKGSEAAKYLALSQAYLKVKAYDEAIQNIQKAVEAGDKPELSYKMLGMAYYQTGRLQQAAQNFERAVEAEQDVKKKAKLYRLMVKLHASNRNYSAAVATADKYLTAAGANNKSILLSKAQAQYQLGDYNGAISTTEKALALEQSESLKAQYYFLIGLAAKKAGNVNKAKEAFDKAMVRPFSYAAKQEAQSLGAR